jgi:hypothetical protein
MNESPTPTYIRNHQAVLKAYGYWPDFHDAPLLSFDQRPGSASTFDLCIHVAEMTSEIDEQGFFGSTKHHQICLRFFGVEDLTRQQFDIPNAVSEMTFSPPSDLESKGRFLVELVSVLGGDCTLTFSATLGEVITVEPRPGWPTV